MSPNRLSPGKRFAVTMMLSVAAFVLLTGQFCPFGGGQAQAPAPAPAPVPSVAPAVQGDQAVAPAAIDTSNLEVKTITLTDANGNARAVLGTDESGSPALTLFDASGGARSRMSLDDKGNAFMDFYDAEGKYLSSYGVNNGDPTLTYQDKSGKTVAIIPKDAPQVVVRPAATATSSRPVAVRNPTTTTQPATPSGTGNQMMVYVMNDKKNYHLRKCARLDNKVKNPMTLSDAIANGYRACDRCMPPSAGSAEHRSSANAPATSGTQRAAGQRSEGSAAGSSGSNPTVFIMADKPNFHLRTCPRLKNKVKNAMSRSDATAAGYHPCDRCKP